MFDVIQQGGPLMWPLLVCSVVAVTVALERLWFNLRYAARQDASVSQQMIELCRADKADEAEHVGKHCNDPTARVLAVGLANRTHSLSESMQAAAMDQLDQLRRGLSVLDTIITLAPLLGILGTVTGIIQSFDLLGDAGIQEPKEVLGGIAQALITTAAGLTIAIMALVPYNYFVARVQRAARRFEQEGTRLEMAWRESRSNAHAT